MKINIAVIDDSKPYSRVIEALLKGLNVDLDVDCNIEIFNTSAEYKASSLNFDLIIIDCILKSDPSGLNGIGLADFTKLHNKDAKVILVSGYADQDFLPILYQYSKSIDYYCSKRMENNELAYKIIEFIKEIKSKKENKSDSVELKLHIYKKEKEKIKLFEINYARVADREKHLIAIGTAEGEKLLSMTLSNFVNLINEALEMAGTDKKEEKFKTDLFINFSNVSSIDRKNRKIKFKNNKELSLDYLNSDNLDLIEKKVKKSKI